VFITPNMCHSMHNCSVGAGDGFLWRIVKRLTASAAYQRGTMAIFATFDESGADDSSDRVLNLLISPSTPSHTRSGTSFTPSPLRRPTEEMLGIDRLLGEARHAASMRAAFNL